MKANHMLLVARLFNRVTVACLALAVMGCLGFFVITLYGFAHQMWMFTLAFALVFLALVAKGFEAFYWHHYRAMRDNLTTDIIEWLTELKKLDKNNE